MQVKAPHAGALRPGDPRRVVEARVEALGPDARRLRVVGGEPLHVLGHEARALEREQHPRQVERLTVGEHIALREGAGLLVVAVLQLADAVVE